MERGATPSFHQIPAFYPNIFHFFFFLFFLLDFFSLSLSLIFSRSRGSCDDWRIYSLLLRRAFISSECKLRSRAVPSAYCFVDTYRWAATRRRPPERKGAFVFGASGPFRRAQWPSLWRVVTGDVAPLSFSPFVRPSPLIFLALAFSFGNFEPPSATYFQRSLFDELYMGIEFRRECEILVARLYLRFNCFLIF